VLRLGACDHQNLISCSLDKSRVAFSARQILFHDGTPEEEAQAAAAFVRPPLSSMLAPGTLAAAATAAAVDVSELYPRAFRSARRALQHFAEANPACTAERRLTMLLALGATADAPFVLAFFI
jgi:hypothetical protein